MATVMSGNIGKQLCEALGLPKQTIGFTLRCYAQELITIECEYAPAGGDVLRALAKYDLMRRPDADAEVEQQPAIADFDAWMRDRTNAAHAAYMERHAAGGVNYTPRTFAQAAKDMSASICRVFKVPYDLIRD